MAITDHKCKRQRKFPTFVLSTAQVSNVSMSLGKSSNSSPDDRNQKHAWWNWEGAFPRDFVIFWTPSSASEMRCGHSKSSIWWPWLSSRCAAKKSSSMARDLVKLTLTVEVGNPLKSYSYGHLPVISYKWLFLWDYTFYKWGYKYL